jgi:hypothetical protein
VGRSHAAARDAGAWLERVTADYLNHAFPDRDIDRGVKRGKNDRGDIGGLRHGFTRGALVVECKNVSARPDLPGWLREAEVERRNDGAEFGVVVHKRHGSRDPGQQHVSMTLETFTRLIGGDPYRVDDPADPDEPLPGL